MQDLWGWMLILEEASSAVYNIHIWGDRLSLEHMPYFIPIRYTITVNERKVIVQYEPTYLRGTSRPPKTTERQVAMLQCIKIIDTVCAVWT